MMACFIKVIIFVGMVFVYVNAYGETSSCEIKLNEPIKHAENGDLEINDYTNLSGDIKKCVDAIGQINHSKNISEIDKLEGIKNIIGSHIKILGAFKNSLAVSEVNLIAKIGSSLKSLENAESSIDTWRIEDLKQRVDKNIGIKEIRPTCLNSYELPDEFTMRNGKKDWSDHADAKTHVDICLKKDRAQYFNDAINLKDKLSLVRDVQLFNDMVEERYISLSNEEGGVIGAGDAGELASFKAAKENLESIRKALNKTLVTDHKLLFSNIETATEIEGCDAPLSALDKISEINDYIENMSKISQGCDEAINKAIQNNNSVLLQKYRKVVDKSILNIDMSVRAVASFSGMQPENNEAVSAIRSEIINFGLNAADEIENLQALSGEKYALPLLANWRSEPLTYQFYAGLEAGEVTGFASNANARLGMLTYFRPGKKLNRVREQILECNQKGETCFVSRFLFLPHWFLKGDYSSAREVSQEAEDDMDTSAEIDTSLEWESGIFLPVYYGARKGVDDLGNINPIKSEFMIGYLYSRGARKITGGNFQNRYYRGVRVAFNEETYFDILQGYSEGVYGSDGNLNKRWEVRAQYPVSKFGLGRVFVGGSINFGHDDKGIAESERKDSYSLYVMWQTSFDDLWSKGESTD